MEGGTPSKSFTKYKIVLVGDQSVGKTSVLNHYMQGTFEAQYQATVGIDFLSKNITLDGKTIKLQLWDTAGQERFKSLIPSYVKDSASALVVYDISSRKSFDNVKNWVQEIRSIRGNEAVIFLVGNKADLAEQRQTTPEEGKGLAEELEIAAFYETSAKTGESIEKLFQDLVGKLPKGNGDMVTPQSPDILSLANRPSDVGKGGGKSKGAEKNGKCCG